MTAFKSWLEFDDHCNSLSRDEIQTTLNRVFMALHCDENGIVAEGESTAANSAADFVESVTYDIDILENTITKETTNDRN